MAEDCYIDLFLTHVVIRYWGPYFFASLTRGSQPGSTGCHLDPATYRHSPATLRTSGLTECLPPDRLTLNDRSVGGYPCMYNFIILMLPSGSWYTWTSSGCQLTWAVLLFSQLEKSLIDGLVKGQHATKVHVRYGNQQTGHSSDI